ncbi:MAG: sugar phosphate isomerase/epimerase [Bacteroidaceae bacterium]|nr:sugar phosphate isomerase/epimerase [Bacteroidaceae bacterium]
MTRNIICALLLIGAIFTSCTTAQKASAPKKEISIQLYSIRDTIARSGNNLDPIFKGLAEMGYTGIEAAGYGGGKFYGYAPEDFKATAEKYGIKVISSHCNRNLTAEEIESGDFSEGLKWWAQAIADHKAAGMKYIVNPWLNRPATLKELKVTCDYFNEIGKLCNAAGLKYGYHNHSHEMVNVENRVMLEYMIENTDPELVFYELDLYWTVMGKKSPVEFFEKYPGRFALLHVKDHREVGQSGMVGFDAIFKNVATAGVQDIIVEIEGCKGTTMDGAKVSIDYLLDAAFVPATYKK